MLLLTPRLNLFNSVINALSMCSPIKVIILGISVFEKWNRTVESNLLAD